MLYSAFATVVASDSRAISPSGVPEAFCNSTTTCLASASLGNS